MKNQRRDEFNHKFNTEVQHHLLNCLIGNPDVFARCRNIVSDEYFDDPLAPSVRFILRHTDEYRALPEPALIHAKTGLCLQPCEFNEEWFLTEIEEFCRRRAIDNVIMQGFDLEPGELDRRLKEALTISLMSDLGTNYFQNPGDRLRRMIDRTSFIGTGWQTLDDKLFGGFSRGGLNVFCGGSGCVVAGTKVKVIKLKAGSDDHLLFLDTPMEMSIEELSGINVGELYLCDSPDGWVPVDQWRSKGPKEVFDLECSGGERITASHDHWFQLSDGNWLRTDKLRVGDVILGREGDTVCVSIEPAGVQLVYDLAIGHENHRYYTNGISSHNSGKSLVLQNLALNWVFAGHIVIYFTLELSEDLVSLRLDSMITGKTTKEVFRNINDTTLMLGVKGKSYIDKLFVKKVPEGSTTVNDLRALLKEFEIQTGHKPDALVIDYLDLMYPTNSRIDPSNLFIKDKFVSEELRALYHETNTFGATASQLNRCVSPDTIVLDERRGEVKVADLCEGDRIVGSSGYVTVKHVFSTVKQKAYMVRTKSGKSIICSTNHRFPTGRGLCSINDGMSVGDTLMTFVEDEIVEILELGEMDLMDVEVDGDHLFLANRILTHNSSVEANGEFDHSHIAGGISKINTADNVIAIHAPNAMKERGEYEMVLLKTRSSSSNGHRIKLRYDPECMRMSDLGETERPRSYQDIKQDLKAKAPDQSKSVLEMMNHERNRRSAK